MLSATETSQHELLQVREAILVRRQEVDEAPFVYGDDPGLGTRPTGRILPLEWLQEFPEDFVVRLGLLILAAVIVREEEPAVEGERRSVAALLQPRWNFPLDLLDERRLAIACVTGNDDESELAGQYRRT